MTLDTEKRTHRLLLQLSFGLFLIVVWYGGHYAVPILPTPLSVLDALIVQIGEGEIIDAAILGTRAIFTGFFISAAIGISVGVMMGLNELFEEFFETYLNALYATPLAAIVPALIIWVGTGFWIRVIAVVWLAVFPIAINTLEGAKSIPVSLMDVATSFGAGLPLTLQRIVIPHEIPFVMAGLRLGMARAVKGLVIAEIIVSITGFGGIIFSWSSTLRLEGVLSVVVVLMMMGVTFTWLVKQVENYFVRWDTSEV